MMPEQLLRDTVEKGLMEIEAALQQYETASQWAEFQNWRRTVDNLLSTEFSGQWPDAMFSNLRFRSKDEIDIERG
jgi:hypothetical protein